MFKEFREFAMRGNVLDLAVGVIIGAAFGGIVTSLVNDVLMPPIGAVMGGLDFSNYFIALRATDATTLSQAKTAGVPVIAYGQFLNTVLNFVIVAFCVFLLVRQVNRFHKAAPQAPSTKECPFCTSGIPVKAIRCPHCTSALDGSAAAA